MKPACQADQPLFAGSCTSAFRYVGVRLAKFSSQRRFLEMNQVEVRGAIAHAVQLTQQAYNAFEKAKEAQFLSDEYASEGLVEKAAQSRAECSAYRRACEVDIGTVTDLLARVAPHVEMSPIEQQTFNAGMLLYVDRTKSYARTPAAKPKKN